MITRLIIRGYKTKSCSAFKSVESHGSLSKSPNKYALNILYNVNVILKNFYIKIVYCLKCIDKYLIYGFILLGILRLKVYVLFLYVLKPIDQ